jgi:hypothetical protein
MFWKVAKRVSLLTIGVGCLAILACEAYALSHIRTYEWQPLFAFFGWRGVAFTAFLSAGLIGICIWALTAAVASSARIPLLGWRIGLLAWVIAVLWLADWVFLEKPLTLRITDTLISEADRREAVAAALDKARSDGSMAVLASDPRADQTRLALMLARIAVNKPDAFKGVSIGRTIDKYATRYNVSRTLLLHWTYIDSFYGEAPAGPLPMFRQLNGETFRDLVQAHLPPWFIESPLRVALIEGPWFDDLAGKSIGEHLRYAVQKADYDIAISPYMNSVYSDLFLIFREYQDEFPELFGSEPPPDPVAAALARSFLALKDTAFTPPYDRPYDQPPRNGAYYDRYRNDLMDFGRAAVYHLTSDFDFATKAQALVAKYYATQYAARLGDAQWAALSERQRTVLLAILRDVYVPNIGRPGPNLYLVTELVSTPIAFVAGEAAKNRDALGQTDKIWLPTQHQQYGHPDRLWGATGLMLRALSETFRVTTGEPLAGVRPVDETENAITVIARRR